ncbi:MAG: threonine--tRNA ligase [Candidatus Colwellbacteria bacterium RIFCSPLOWO2_12_FULL_44_13]|uniref:Threonine--tRNA ligase n=3 Tax=Candidatus Colwelliibacteriota TaxID=1817904 RepID=A0A1G1ZD03_9BACT|nr:MAG: threonine--tRNA ligase [Candidatus Colwellbacteria bacterium RIFCSPLOWO2_12_FULL_44_13]
MQRRKDSPASIENIRHSLAHVLAAAVLEKFPDAQLGIGPVIENGFYYDFKFVKPITNEVLPELQKSMQKIIKQNLAFSGKKVTAVEVKKLFKNQPFKLDLIKEFVREKKDLTVYKTGTVFVDLCRGGHVKNTKEIAPDAFKLTTLAGAYWRGDEKNPQLQRIYALAFATKKELDSHIKLLEEAERRDHKKLGPELDLFVFSDLVGGGLPLWTPKGTMLRNLLDDFVWQLRKARGYMRVEIPHITKRELYERSGHWEKFKDDLFRINTREGHEFAMKPMNCPHHTQIYKRRLWSYRELPQRYANTTMVYRDEQSGELAGLSRVRSITQDDAHVFCRIGQAKEEFIKIWDIVHEFYGAFNIPLRVRLSTHDPKHPEKYLGDKKRWAFAEQMLRDIAKEKKADAFDGIGEAAFYGPKLDFMGKDAIGREHQVATIQLDLNMPERFDLTCTNEKGEAERIVMIHAAIMGSIERFLAVAIEHYAGAFPLWLSPTQVLLLPISVKHSAYAKKVFEELTSAGTRVEILDESETLGKRIREGELKKVPYLVVLGDREVKSKTLAIRKRGKGDIGALKLSEFVAQLQKEISSKK